MGENDGGGRKERLVGSCSPTEHCRRRHRLPDRGISGTRGWTKDNPRLERPHGRRSSHTFPPSPTFSSPVGLYRERDFHFCTGKQGPVVRPRESPGLEVGKSSSPVVSEILPSRRLLFSDIRPLPTSSGESVPRNLRVIIQL